MLGVLEALLVRLLVLPQRHFLTRRQEALFQFAVIVETRIEKNQLVLGVLPGHLPVIVLYHRPDGEDAGQGAGDSLLLFLPFGLVFRFVSEREEMAPHHLKGIGVQVVPYEAVLLLYPRLPEDLEFSRADDHHLF